MSKDDVLAVLKKAAEDDSFLAQLTDDSTEALKNLYPEFGGKSCTFQ